MYSIELRIISLIIKIIITHRLQFILFRQKLWWRPYRMGQIIWNVSKRKR